MASSQFEPMLGTLCPTHCWGRWKRGKNVELYGLYDILNSENDWREDLQGFVLG